MSRSDGRRWSIVLVGDRYQVVQDDAHGHWYTFREALHRKVVVNKALAELECDRPAELELTPPEDSPR